MLLTHWSKVNLLFKILLGFSSCIYLLLITIISGFFIQVFFLLKILLPKSYYSRYLYKAVDTIAEYWVSLLLFWIKRVLKLQCRFQGSVELSKHRWYFIISNHQSWSDIIAILVLTHPRTHILRFFIKQQLAWIPILGQAWWLLDYPFMNRKSHKQEGSKVSNKKPDLQATLEACEIYKTRPTAVVNFIEGTRFNKIKKSKESSPIPYTYLMPPKAGGAALVIQSLYPRTKKVVDVTLYYPQPITFLSLLSSRHQSIVVHVKERDIPNFCFTMNYANSNDRDTFKAWITQLWLEKDALLKELQKQNKYHD